MPMPGSLTEIRTSRSRRWTATTICPPCGLYLIAFCSRLTSTCSSRSLSPRTTTGSGGRWDREEVGARAVQLALLGDVQVDHQPAQVLAGDAPHRHGRPREPAVPRPLQLDLVARGSVALGEDVPDAGQHRRTPVGLRLL